VTAPGTTTTERFAAGGRRIALLAAMIALAGQIALGSVVLRASGGPTEAARLDAVALLCHAGGAAAMHGKSLPHHPSGVQLSALAQALAQAAGLLGPASVRLCAPQVPALFIPQPWSARAPPASVRLAAQPRGPPSLA
jgi:hypothetical protein